MVTHKSSYGNPPKLGALSRRRERGSKRHDLWVTIGAIAGIRIFEESLSCLPTVFSVLRHPNFRSYLSARILGTIAVQMQSVAIGWQVFIP